MEHVITWGNPHVEFEFSYAEDKPVRMTGLCAPGVDFRWESNLPIAEILLSGTGHWIANDRLTHTTVGRDCRYAGHEVLRDEARKVDRLVITERCADPELEIKVTYELPRGGGGMLPRLCLRREPWCHAGQRRIGNQLGE